MSDTLTNVTLPAGTWVNLYSATGITVGTKIAVQNLSTMHVYLCVKSTAPTDLSTYTLAAEGATVSNDTGDSGAWAYSHNGGKVNVRIA